MVVSTGLRLIVAGLWSARDTVSVWRLTEQLTFEIIRDGDKALWELCSAWADGWVFVKPAFLGPVTLESDSVARPYALTAVPMTPKTQWYAQCKDGWLGINHEFDHLVFWDDKLGQVKTLVQGKDQSLWTYMVWVPGIGVFVQDDCKLVLFVHHVDWLCVMSPTRVAWMSAVIRARPSK